MIETSMLYELKGLVMRIPFGNTDLKVLNTVLISNESIQFEHSHNCFEVYLLVEGDAEFYIDGQKTTLKQGQICWINPGVMRYAENDPRISQKQFIITFDFAPKAKDGQIQHSLCFDKVLQNILSKPFWVEQDTNGCTECFRSICTEMTYHKFGYLLKTQNLLSSFILSAMQSLDLPKPVLESSHEDFEELAYTLISYIRHNYTEDISLEMAAKELNISPRHITRTMKDSLNTTFKRTLDSFRIEHVKHFLCHTDLSTEKIAEKVGFSSANVLLKNFRKITGFTITEYKELFTVK